MSETEPPQITNPENPDSWSHRDIDAAFKNLDPEPAWSFSRVWSECASRWTDALTTFAAELDAARNASWEGMASRRARNAINSYTLHAAKLSDEFTTAEQRIHASGEAISRTKSRVPSVGLSDIFQEDPDERNEAREAMQNHYIAGFMNEDNGIPILIRALTPVTGSATIAGAGVGDGTSVSSGSSGWDTATASASPSAGAVSTIPDTAADSVETPADIDDESHVATQPADAVAVTTTADRPSAETLENNATRSAGIEPTRLASVGTPLLPAATPLTAQANPESSISPLYTPRTAAEPNRRNDSPQQAPLAALPLAGVPPAATPPAGPPSSAAKPVVHGMPGMPAPGSRRDDNEVVHTTPDYLITEENGNALVGNLPKTVPPVLGA